MIYQVTITEQADADLRGIYEKEPWRSRELRVMPVDNYLVFYIADKNLGLVTVIRVMYAGRDVDNQLINHTVN